MYSGNNIKQTIKHENFFKYIIYKYKNKELIFIYKFFSSALYI